MHTVRRALALVAAVLVAALGIGLLPARPAAAAGGPFDCQPGLYQVISGQLKLLNPVAGVYTDIGTAGPTYNALGYNVEDDHLYAMGTQSGVNQGHLLRIASDGSVTSLGVPTNLPVGSYVAGDFDDQGNLLIRANATTLYSIDVSAGPPVATPLSLTGAALNGVDLVWIGDALYSTDGDLLYRVDLATLVVTTVAVSGLTSGQYGAAWSDQPDNLYVSNNATGVISQITGFTGPTPAATARVTATITSNNDGAACKQAADPFLPPAAANDAYAATVDVPLVVPAATGILDNDTGTGLTVQSHTQPSHGTVTVNADGSFAYTPAPGYLGPDSFTYVAV
ncbi:MAG: Ig-like domain-containing protein, partial [Acidimicrobiales bacterium]|nr:Ig-like domain-containing protein [Acidimicrobiales bacterium]